MKIDNYQHIKLVEIQQEIYRQNEEYILKVNKDDYVNHLFDKYFLESVELQEEDMLSDTTTANILGSEFPNSYHRVSNQLYHEYCVSITVPIVDSDKLLVEFEDEYGFQIKQDQLIFLITKLDKKPKEMEEAIAKKIDEIKQLMSSINSNVKLCNNAIYQEINKHFVTRKNDIQSNTEFLNQLSIPVRKKKDVPKTFSIPKPELRKKIKYTKPKLKNDDKKVYPFLVLDTYRQILNTINDVGKQLERSPSIYEGKQEEELRDIILFVLEPHYEGSATGETFNKNGKTDILLRYEGENAFIAECKFWGGMQELFWAIDQLFDRYLTWRDNKVALIIFVQNKNMTKVINTVKEEINTHKYYSEEKEANDETWLNYIFKSKEDEDRLVHTAIMLYHLPKYNDCNEQ